MNRVRVPNEVESHFYVEIDTDPLMGESIELLECPEDHKLSITISSDHAGDSESGFGRDLSTAMNRAAATKLRDGIDKWLAQP